MPFALIVPAVNESVEAISAIVRHFEPYINSLVVKMLFDEHGDQYAYVDEEEKQLLEVKLIQEILKFDLR